MDKKIKIVIVIALIVVVAVVIAIKHQGKNPSSMQAVAANQDQLAFVDGTGNLKISSEKDSLPRLVDVGAGKCIPCKMMKPILDELKQKYNDQFKVTFVDVQENPDEAKKFKINIIPTQIFYGTGGEELFRHEGFYSKEDILTKWKELGVELGIGGN